jgi:hypothetical protein
MPGNPLLTTYDPEKVILTFGGTPLSGWAEGSFIDIAQAAKAYTRKTGADGETVRSKSANKCNDVTVTLQQSSLSNDYLSAMNQKDRATGRNTLPLSITDLNGKTLMFWPQAWVEVPDSWGYGAEVTDRAWVFHTGSIATDNRGGISV